MQEKKKVDLSDKAKAAERDRVDKSLEDQSKKQATDAMNKLISDLQNPVYGDALQEVRSCKSLKNQPCNCVMNASNYEAAYLIRRFAPRAPRFTVSEVPLWHRGGREHH